MEEKIKAYVQYHFRNKSGKEKEELIEEVSMNLLEDYETRVARGEEKEKAFRSAISRMGDFSSVEDDFEKQYDIKPELFDVGLFVAVILSVFGLVSTLFSLVLGLVITIISIVLFSSSAYYTYHKAHYEKQVNGDIEGFYLYLDKSFSSLKTAFVFWAITLSILLGVWFGNMGFFLSATSMTNIASIGDLILGYFVFIIIAGLLVGSVFAVLYIQLMRHYKRISGKDSLDGSLKKGLNKLDLSWGLSNKRKEPFIISLFLGLILISLLTPLDRVTPWEILEGTALNGVFYLIRPSVNFIGLPIVVCYLIFLYIAISSLIKKTYPMMRLYIMQIILTVVIIVVFTLSEHLFVGYFTYPSGLNILLIMLVSALIASALLITEVVKRKSV